MHLLATPTTNTAVEQVHIEQMVLQPQLMTDTDHAQALTKPTATQPQNTTSTVQDKAQSKRQHLVTPHTINMALKLVVTKQIPTAQPQLMTDTDHAQALTKPTATQPQNTTSTVQDKAQSKRQHLVTPHTINMALKLVVTKQIPTAQPHLMTSTAERLAHSKQIPLAEQPNTTVMAEKSEALNR